MLGLYTARFYGEHGAAKSCCLFKIFCSFLRIRFECQRIYRVVQKN